MAGLSLQFPNLEVCVLSLHILHKVLTPPTGPDPIDTARGVHNVTRINGSYKITSFENSLVELLRAFLERGPGRRKFVRFSHGLPAKHPLYFGPMVGISS